MISDPETRRLREAVEHLSGEISRLYDIAISLTQRVERLEATSTDITDYPSTS